MLALLNISFLQPILPADEKLIIKNLDCEKRLTHGHIPRLQTSKLKEVEILKLSDEELAVYINFFNKSCVNFSLIFKVIYI